MWRPLSDIGRLQFRDVHLATDKDGYQQAILHNREPKEAQVKSITLGEYKVDEEMCSVHTLRDFIQQTTTLPTDLATEHTLFLTHMDKIDIASQSITPTTVANWIKTALQAAGIDIKYFQAHSIRAASSTRAQMNSVTRYKRSTPMQLGACNQTLSKGSTLNRPLRSPEVRPLPIPFSLLRRTVSH